jgi:hypothetical protein
MSDPWDYFTAVVSVRRQAETLELTGTEAVRQTEIRLAEAAVIKAQAQVSAAMLRLSRLKEQGK